MEAADGPHRSHRSRVTGAVDVSDDVGRREQPVGQTMSADITDGEVG